MDRRNEDSGEMPQAYKPDVKIETAIGQITTRDTVRSIRPRRSDGDGEMQDKKLRKRQLLDWSRYEVNNASSFIKFLRGFKWGKTSLGPMSSWSIAFRLHFNSIIAHPQPRGLFWGPDQILLYNEACIPLIGKKHPEAMGQPISHFGDFFAKAAPAISMALEEGRVTSVINFPVTMERNDDIPSEECFWSFDLVPVCGENGEVEGVLNTLTETTSVVVAERRIATVLDIARETTGYDTINDVWEGIIAALTKNPDDVPYAILYSVKHGSESGSERSDDEDTDHDSKDDTASRGGGDSGDEDGASTTDGDNVDSADCRCVGTVGLSEDDEHIPRELSMKKPEQSQGLSNIFRTLAKDRSTILLDGTKGEVPEWLRRGIEGRAGGLVSQKVLAIPIPPTTGSGLLGFLILGLSARRPYDEDYKLFVKLLCDRLLSTTAQVQMPEGARDAQNAAEEAALRHAALSRQLALKAQEAERNEIKLARMAEQAPVGMANLNSDLVVQEANDEYYRLTGVTRGDDEHWADYVFPGDEIEITNNLIACRDTRKAITFQYRLRKPWSSTDKATGLEIHGHCWINALLFPEIEQGEAVRINAWLTDISLAKWTEESQTRKLEEALELKRQRENFIDMTSHEMRNPLSAILQSSEGIVDTLAEVPKDDKGGITLSEEALETILEAARTINLCGQHQKNIVDDVLTISKLDSRLIVLAPDRVQPRNLVQNALKMYQAEIERAGMTASIVVDESYEDLEIDEVILDPSRLLQVLINLLTNAIKFTRNEERETEKRISIILSASNERPDIDISHKITFIPVREKRDDSTHVSNLQRRLSSYSEQSLSGQPVYLQFAVNDSGRGLTEEELNTLFMRFSQASARTYGTYGGSGLGLFISRELTELQGGQIGVSSQAGVGSTFAFYIKAIQVLPLSRRSSNISVTSSAPTTGSSSCRPQTQRNLSAMVEDPGTNGDTTPSERLTEKKEPNAKKRNLHILLTEDNIINQKVISAQLRRLGNTVHVANHGLEALHFLQRTSFADGCSGDVSLPANPTQQDHPMEDSDASPIPLDIMLLDQEMPVLDGLETIKKVREWQKQGYLNGHLPVIAVTANARSEQKDELIQSGVDDVVTKPFRIPDLVEQMEILLQRFDAEGG